MIIVKWFYVIVTITFAVNVAPFNKIDGTKDGTKIMKHQRKAIRKTVPSICWTVVYISLELLRQRAPKKKRTHPITKELIQQLPIPKRTKHVFYGN